MRIKDRPGFSNAVHLFERLSRSENDKILIAASTDEVTGYFQIQTIELVNFIDCFRITDLPFYRIKKIL